MNAVFLSDPLEVKRMLSSTEFTRSDNFAKMVGDIIGPALFLLPTGDDWKRHRKLLQPGFGPTHLRHTAKVTIETIKTLKSEFNKLLKNEENIVDFQQTMTMVTLDILGQVAFGHDFQFTSQSTTSLDFSTLTSVPIKRVIIPRALWKFAGIHAESPNVKLFTDTLQKLMRTLAKERQDRIDTGAVKQENWDMDVMQRLLLSQGEGKLSEEELFGELLGFFIAGHETTSGTLSFIMMELCKNPEIQQKLYETIKDVEFTEDANYADVLQKLEYLDWIVKETQRLHSIVGSVARTSAYEVTVCGYTFPPGTPFAAYIRAIHLDPNNYTDPDSFLPDRWSTPPKPMTFLPFGDGIHNCIGQKMAIIETKVLWTK
jgi:cytochrome P450